MSKYKAVISDVDGTLTLSGFNTYPNKIVIRTIKKARNKGIIFSLATGRPLFLLKYLLDFMDIPMLVIFDNGAGIYDSVNKKVIWEAALENQVVNELLNFVYVQYKKDISLSISDGGELKNPKKVSKNARVLKIAILSLALNDADKLVKDAEKRYKNIYIVKAPSYYKGSIDVYISSVGATKQHAVLKLAEILGILPQEIIGIGDNYNDFPLLMACGLKVAMGNAVEDLKAIADYIAPTVEKNGVAEVINRFILK